jgi:hypothetical protein
MAEFSEEDVVELAEMMAVEAAAARKALTMANGDKAAAVEILFVPEDVPPLVPLGASGWDSDNASMQGQASAPRNSPELLPPDAREGAGWSNGGGSWSHTETTATSAWGEPSRAVVLRPSEPDAEMQRALQESLLSHSQLLEAQAPVDRSFEDHLTPMDQVRGLEEGAPLVLRSTPASTPWLPLLLQGLYALPAFRNAILSLDLTHESLDPELRYTYDQYWNGKRTYPGTTLRYSADGRDAHLDLLRAIQRLFVFMTCTRRRVVNVQDVANALNVDVAASSSSQAPVGKYKGESRAQSHIAY